MEEFAAYLSVGGNLVWANVPFGCLVYRLLYFEPFPKISVSREIQVLDLVEMGYRYHEFPE